MPKLKYYEHVDVPTFFEPTMVPTQEDTSKYFTDKEFIVCAQKPEKNYFWLSCRYSHCVQKTKDPLIAVAQPLFFLLLSMPSGYAQAQFIVLLLLWKIVFFSFCSKTLFFWCGWRYAHKQETVWGVEKQFMFLIERNFWKRQRSQL